ncbi:hypothetical protein [Stenoxybacter acetivorans]|uniref:hypothetical protein n=1 Tax=Stenoxybacter acetivorans TaxID=422441 RepID=UPI0005618A31|nr:hypothetical protein [Stenoxybacter acetivorans]
MKRLMLLCVLCLLNACATWQTVETQKITENIHGFFFNPQESFIYALGDNFDYQLSPCPQTQMKTGGIKVSSEQCLKTFDFVLKHQSDHTLLRSEFLNFTVASGKNDVSGHLTIYWDKAKLVQQNGWQNLDFRDLLSAQPLNELNVQTDKQYTQEQVMMTPFYFTGKTLRLRNRQELLDLHQIEPPLQVPLSILKQERRIQSPNIGKIIETTMWIIVITPMIPLAIFSSTNQSHTTVTTVIQKR